MKNCQGSSKVYTIKSQYTHHLSLLQMMFPSTPKGKKRFWVLAFGVCERNKTHTHTQYTHTSCVRRHFFFSTRTLCIPDCLWFPFCSDSMHSSWNWSWGLGANHMKTSSGTFIKVRTKEGTFCFSTWISRGKALACIKHWPDFLIIFSLDAFHAWLDKME